MSGPAKRTPDTYWLLEGVSLLVIHALGGLFVAGEENIPKDGPVLLVSNHVSYLDPVSIGDASSRRVVFMAKAELFKVPVLGFLLRGVDSFPVRRGAADTSAIRTALSMLKEGRVVCIFPEGTRGPGGDELLVAEPGAALIATRVGCPVVPVFVRGTDMMLGKGGKLRRAKITVAFGEPFSLERGMDRVAAGEEMLRRIEDVRASLPTRTTRRIYPHWIKKAREGSRGKGEG